jgi:hypothetical protein
VSEIFSASPEIAEHLMGHKDLATTQIYARVEQQHLREVVSKLTSLIPDDVPPKCVTRGILRKNLKITFY